MLLPAGAAAQAKGPDNANPEAVSEKFRRVIQTDCTINRLGVERRGQIERGALGQRRRGNRAEAPLARVELSHRCAQIGRTEIRPHDRCED
jgi:hypothetical protein